MPPPLGNTAIRVLPPRPWPAAVTANNAGHHEVGRFALLTLTRLGTAAGAPGSAAWATAATTTALRAE